MSDYILVSSWRRLGPELYSGTLNDDLVVRITASSLKEAAQEFIRTKEFDRYLSQWTSVDIYHKSIDDRMSFLPPDLDLEEY